MGTLIKKTLHIKDKKQYLAQLVLNLTLFGFQMQTLVIPVVFRKITYKFMPSCTVSDYKTFQIDKDQEFTIHRCYTHTHLSFKFLFS